MDGNCYCEKCKNQFNFPKVQLSKHMFCPICGTQTVIIKEKQEPAVELFRFEFNNEKKVMVSKSKKLILYNENEVKENLEQVEKEKISAGFGVPCYKDERGFSSITFNVSYNNGNYTQRFVSNDNLKIEEAWKLYHALENKVGKIVFSPQIFEKLKVEYSEAQSIIKNFNELPDDLKLLIQI